MIGRGIYLHRQHTDVAFPRFLELTRQSGYLWRGGAGGGTCQQCAEAAAGRGRPRRPGVPRHREGSPGPPQATLLRSVDTQPGLCRDVRRSSRRQPPAIRAPGTRGSRGAAPAPPPDPETEGPPSARATGPGAWQRTQALAVRDDFKAAGKQSILPGRCRCRLAPRLMASQGRTSPLIQFPRR